MTTSTAPVRSLEVIAMEVRFAAEFAELNEKLWSHFDTYISLAQIIAGAMAFAGIFIPGSVMTGVAGAALAVMSGVQLGLKPRERSFAFRDTRRELHDLNVKIWDQTVPQAEGALEKIKAVAPRGIEALTTPAQNRILLRHGYPTEVERLTPWESVVATLAA